MSLLMILAIVVALVLTIFGAFVKNKEQIYYAPMIHGAAILAWMLATWGMVTYALVVWPGTSFLPTAFGLFGFSMVIIQAVLILLPYIKERKNEFQKYELRQADYRHKIAKMTNKNKEKMWWQ